MKSISKICVLLARLVLPKKVFSYLSNRLIYAKKIIRSYASLRGLQWVIKALFYLPCLIFALLASICRILILCVLPIRKYLRLNKFFSTFRYACNDFYQDMVVRKREFALSWKRFLLHEELFFKGREVDRSYGEENPDKTFFVLRPYYFFRPNECVLTIPHLLTNYYSMLILFENALNWGYIPVVDWQNYKVPHSEEAPVLGTMNAWEYYWKQPSEYTLEEVYRSKHVVLSNMNIPSGGSLPPLRTPKTNIQKYAQKIIQAGAPLAAEISFNDFTLNYINEAQEKLFPKDGKIMGVALRGTSYSKMKSGHHAVQPEIEELARMVLRRKEEWGVDYVFFTNEESETVAAMQELLGDILLVLDRKRYVNYHIYSDNSPTPTDEDLNPLYTVGQRYQTNLDYITEMVLLSRCDCLLTALSNGIKAVLMWNGGRYEHMEILDRGTYAEAWEKRT